MIRALRLTLLRHCLARTFSVVLHTATPKVESTTHADCSKPNPASNDDLYVILCFLAERATGRRQPWTGCRTAAAATTAAQERLTRLPCVVED